MYHVLDVIVAKHFPNPRSQGFFPMFYLKMFAILGFTYFKIMDRSSVFAHGYPIVPAPIVENTVLVLLLRISCPHVSISGFCIFFLSLSLHQYHTLLFTVAL